MRLIPLLKPIALVISSVTAPSLYQAISAPPQIKKLAVFVFITLLLLCVCLFTDSRERRWKGIEGQLSLRNGLSSSMAVAQICAIFFISAFLFFRLEPPNSFFNSVIVSCICYFFAGAFVESIKLLRSYK